MEPNGLESIEISVINEVPVLQVIISGRARAIKKTPREINTAARARGEKSRF